MFESAVFVLTCAFNIALAISHDKQTQIEENINGTIIDPKWNTTIPVWNVITDPDWVPTKNWDTVIPIENNTSSYSNITTQNWNITNILVNTTTDWNEINPDINVTIPGRNSNSSNWNSTTPNWNLLIIFPVNTTKNWDTTIPIINTTGSYWNTTASNWGIESSLPDNTSIPEENTTITNRNILLYPFHTTESRLHLNNSKRILIWNNITTLHQRRNMSISSKNISKTSYTTTPVMNITEYLWNTTDSEWNSTTTNWNIPLNLLNTRVKSNKIVQRIKTTTTPSSNATFNWNYYITNYN